MVSSSLRGEMRFFWAADWTWRNCSAGRLWAGDLCPQTPLLSGLLDCHVPQGCICCLPSGVRHPGSSQVDRDSPFLLVKGSWGLFWVRASLGSWASTVPGLLLWGVLHTLPKSPMLSLFPMLWSVP